MADSILVVAAHPDDEVLGCGGTIARLAAEGHNVHVAMLGEGVTARHAQRSDADQGEIQALRSACSEVGRLLGAASVQTFGLPDNRFDSVDLLDVVKMIEKLIRDVGPKIVYTQHGGDLNIDHQIVYRATLAATRPHPQSDCVKTLYAYEVPSSTEWAFQQFSPAFRPNVFVDISKTLETKLKALALYETEVRRFPHPRSPEALRAIAHRWGSVSGLQAAEAFDLVRHIV